MDRTFVQVSAAKALWLRWLLHWATALGVVVAMVGAGHLAAWFSGYMAHRGFSVITMKTNTALSLLLTGMALVMLVPSKIGLVRRWIGRGMAALAALIGLLSLCENLIGWDLSIDQLLAKEPPGALGAWMPNLMGPPASVSILLAGLALLILSRRDGRGTKVAQFLTLAVGLISLLGTIGFLYGVQSLHTIVRLTGIAWPTSTALLMLSFGLLLARPTEGLMTQVTADDPGGANIRRWLPVLLLPVLLGWLRLAGERQGIFDAGTGTAVMMIIFIVALAVLAYRGAQRVSLSSSALRESENKLRLFIEHAPAAIAMLDTEMKYIVASRSWFTAYGVNEQDIIGRSHYEVFPDIPERWKNIHRRVLAGSIERNDADPWIRADGHTDLVRWELRPWYGSNNVIGGMIIFSENITERKRAEEAERASRTKLAAAFASMTEAIFIADASGRLTDFNDEFVRYHRFKNRDECSRTIDDCPKYLEAYFADGTPAPVEQWAMPRALRGEMASNVEYRLRRRETGETWWGSYSFAPIKDKDGEIAGAIVSAREITALKQAEAAVRQSEERLRYHLENSPLAVVEWDTEFIVTRWAGESEKIFGWSAAETVGKPIMDLRMDFEEDIPIVQKTMEKLTDSNSRHVVSTNRNYTKDGRVIHCTWYNTVLQDATGKMKSVMSQVLDITERKKAEDEIVRRSAILTGINTVFKEALTCATDEELSEVCLKMAEEITASKVGFIGEIGPDGLLHDIAISNPGWEACTMYDKTGFRRPPGNFHIHGIYERVLLDGKSFYTKDPFTHPDSIGIPEGHPPITAFLGVPLKHGGKTIGMIGVGNRQGGYRKNDMETLEAVAPSIVETLMRKRAEESLANAKSALEQERDILQSVMDGAKNSHLVYLDRDFNFVRVNETYAQTCGYRPEQMIGKNHFALYPHAENEAIFARVRDSGKPVVFHDKPFEFPDQPERGVTYWDWTLTPFKNPSGQVSGLVFSLFETTERKKAERQQALLAKILSILNDPPALDDAINLILSAIKQETGFAAVGLRLHCGDDFPYFAHDGFSNDFLLAENTLAARDRDGGICRDNDGNIRLECTCGLVISGLTDPANPLFTPKGSFWTNESFGLLDIPADEDPRHRPRNRCIHEGFHSVALIPLRTGNKIIGMLQLNDRRPNQFTREMISFFEDLGDVIGIAFSRKQAADDMKRAKELSDALNLELEAANKELDAFSYSVSHDLRAPLRHMAGFAEQLKKRLEGQADEKANKYLETISEASKKMEVLINDLLSFSHIGRADMRKRKIDFNALVRGVVREIHEEVPERDISWDIDALPEVLGDQSLLRLVIVNLVSNAVKYTATRSLAEIKIGCKDEGDEFVFFFKDNGVGFDMKYVDRLFGVFQRLHPRDEFEGTGIGLANVQRIISRHGGRVWAEGVVEKGATFYFTLPNGKVK